MSKKEMQQRLIRDTDRLVIDLHVIDAKTKQEIELLTKLSYLFNVAKAREEHGKENYEVQLIEPDFELRLLDSVFSPEVRLNYRISNKFSHLELRNKDIEVVLKISDLERLHREMNLLAEEKRSIFEKVLRLELEIERLKQERARSENDFTAKIKEIESGLNLKVKDGLKRREEEIVARFKADVDDLKLYGSQALLTDLLPHFLTLKSVIESGKDLEDKTIQAYLKGFDMVVRTISETLTSFGIEEIFPKVGDRFDANLHSGESTSSDKTMPEGVILEVKLNGYKLYDRLIIPAVVVVNKH